jgi:hypothetical protein
MRVAKGRASIGWNNVNLELARGRMVRGQSYRDLSTVCLIPSRSAIPPKVVQSWLGLATPMNQKFTRIFLEGMEVGDAYNQGIECILNHPELSTWPYVLTLETDNCPPPDGLLKLYESMKTFDAVGGLYWVKGELGQPMIYGDPKVMPKNFIPQLPIPDAVQECNGLGMGFTLFKLAMFKTLPKPWFKTLQEQIPGQGMRAATQDLYFFQEAARHGYRFASDNRVRVGHYDAIEDRMW